LRRWAIAGDITLDDAFFASDNGSFDFEPTYLYFPIPTSELDRNANMIQNPGY
jgi:starch-binding outer membrane protein, SusD/RagB family